MNPNLIVLSRATAGATPAATYSFITRGYKPPDQPRALAYDIVHNQNGKFKWIYDNGPTFKRWQTFTIRCDNSFTSVVGAIAATQLSRLQTLWDHKGAMGMKAPEGVYSVHWAEEVQERSFIVFPRETNNVMEFDVAVTFEEA